MVIKFHDRDDRGYSDILYEIYSIDIMGLCTPEHSITQSHGNYHVLLPLLDGYLTLTLRYTSFFSCSDLSSSFWRIFVTALVRWIPTIVYANNTQLNSRTHKMGMPNASRFGTSCRNQHDDLMSYTFSVLPSIGVVK